MLTTSVLRPRTPGRPPFVWRRALELAADPTARHDRLALALDLLRAAEHDPGTMKQALRLGQARVWAHADDLVAAEATDILEAAMKFLGVRPTVVAGG